MASLKIKIIVLNHLVFTLGFDCSFVHFPLFGCWAEIPIRVNTFFFAAVAQRQAWPIGQAGRSVKRPTWSTDLAFQKLLRLLRNRRLLLLIGQYGQQFFNQKHCTA